MTKNTLWTILGVVGAIVIAWVLVDVVFKLVWLVVKIGLVAVVALVVFAVLRLFMRSSD